MKIGYLHIGPERSGVRRYGRLLAEYAKHSAKMDVVEADVCPSDNATELERRLRDAAETLADADVVHIQYNKKVWGGGWSHVKRIRAFARRCQGKLVVTSHDVYAPAAFSELIGRGGRWRRELGLAFDPTRFANGYLARKASAIVVHSDEDARRFRRVSSCRNLHVIPHFVEERCISTSVSDARGDLGLTGAKVVTLLGFILPRKGYGLLLDALPALSKDVVIIFAGGAPVGGEAYVDELRRRIEREGVGNRVRMTGYLSEQELEKYLVATDLAVCPFEELSASGSLATWISVAKPILASDLPQIREYNELEPGAIRTFEPRTADALAQAVTELLPTCQDQPDPAVARLRDRLSMPKIFEEHLRVYRDVAAAGRTRGERDHRTQSDGAARPNLRVAFLPLWLRNPYQGQLERHLSLRGVHLSRLGRTAGSIVVRLVMEHPKILHLHWLHAFYESGNTILSIAKFMFSLLGFAAVKILGVKMVWTAHNIRHHESKNPVLDRLCTRFVARFSDAIIAHSETAKHRIVAEVGLRGNGGIHVVPHGNYVGVYENKIDRAEARKQLEVSQDALVYLFLGQVRPYKGVLELVEAFKKLDAPVARLIIAGKPLLEEAAHIIRRKIGGDARITFVAGFVPDEKIQVYMNAADAVVLPYRDILTSGAAILAMSFGRACIAPRMGCMIDCFDDSGACLYEAGAPAGLQTAMQEALTRRDELPAMGKRNRRVADEWGWQRVADDTLEIYRSILPAARR